MVKKHSSVMRNKKTIAVFTPYLGGFYLGEVSASIRYQAAKRGMSLIIVRTNSFGSFDLDLALNNVDGVIVILNSLSIPLMQRILERGIPVVATVGDYFPLEVDAVISDQRSGIQKAFEHLSSMGHTKIGFAGDISVVDMRLRYEAFLECYQAKGLEYKDEYFYSVEEFTIPGGRHAGQMFIDRGKNTSAIICACDLTAIGFQEHVKKDGVRIPEDLLIVGVDNTTIGQERPVSLSSVDQGLDALVETSFDRIEARINGDKCLSEPILIEQSLCIRQSSGGPAPTSELDKPAITREPGLTQNQNESVMALAKSGYDSILNMSCLLGPFLKWGCLGLWSSDDKGAPKSETKLKLTTFMSQTLLDNDLAEYEGIECSAEDFPPHSLKDLPVPDLSLINLVPISGEDGHWGVLVTVDELRQGDVKSNYSMFNNYLDLVSFFMQRDALVSSVREREKSAKDLAERLEAVAKTSNDGIWTWDLENNSVEWNNRLLEILGFTDKRDIEIYRNMSFFERIHPQDQGYIRRLLKSHLEGYKVFKAKFRIQAHSGKYIWVDANGESIREPNGHVGRFVGTMTDITEQRRSEKKIKQLVYHDSLTGLPNRTSVTEALNAHIKENTGQGLAVMLMDLNRFKMVNDSYGHQAGDALLIHVAKSVRRSLRSTDLLARFGGDEFLLLSRVKSEEEAIALSERILSSLNGMFRDGNGVELAVKASLGISLYPDHSDTPEELIKKADIAMQRAKNKLLDRAILYSDDMDVGLKDMMAKESHLRRSIEHNELFLVFQPQVDTKTEKVVGAEVLARWQSKHFGFVSPGIFIPLAEETGFINLLGEWVLDESLKVLKKWNEQGDGNIKLSINVSAGQLHDPGFAGRVCEKVESAGIPPGSLTLEITESAAITDVEQSRKELKKLTDLGVVISLDDFGTGYSSLSLLNSLPLQWVKIDKSFISLLEEHDAKTGLVKSITEMCHSLGYRVVAEGVETDPQLDLVREIGCDQVQGFIYARPVTLGEFEEKYLRNSEDLSRQGK